MPFPPEGARVGQSNSMLQSVTRDRSRAPSQRVASTLWFLPSDL